MVCDLVEGVINNILSTMIIMMQLVISNGNFKKHSVK